MEKYVPFAQQLKKERERQSWSQEEVAARVETTQKTVARWEKGTSHPRPYYQRKLCELFGKTAEEFGLLNGSDTEESQSDLLTLPTTVIPSEEMTPATPPEQGRRSENLDDAPYIEHFYGRQSELTLLKQIIVEQRSQIVAILGMGGIGKTTLTTHLVRQIQDTFEGVYWQSLQNAPPLKLVLKQFLQQYVDQQHIHTLDSTEEYLSLFIHYLQEHRCLVVLDNMESLLQGGSLAGRYREGYEEYQLLLQRVRETRHKSCILLTSREKPGEIAHQESSTGPVRAFQLKGIDLAGGKEILGDREISGSNKHWKTLIDRYSGNPLALKLVSEFIKSVFNGDIAQFLEEEDLAFGDINDLLDQQFRRLQVKEQEVLFWLAIEREAINLERIRENLAKLGTRSDLVVILNSLNRRFLIETREAAQFSLQPVIMEFITDVLVKRACQEFMEKETSELFPTWVNFAFTQAQITEHIRESQAHFILHVIADQLLTTLNQQEIEKRLTSMLNMLRQRPVQQQGYAAGNILNLLIELKFELRGRDFSGLTIRQAYLQGALLPDVNFARSHFISSIFTNTFGSIPSIKFSPSGRLLAVGTSTGDVWIYQAMKGTPLCICRGHTDGIWSLTFSSDERTLISSGDDRTIRLWDSNSGICLQTLTGHQNRVRTIALTPDDSLLVSGSDDATIRLWDIQTSAYLSTLAEPDEADRTFDNRIWSVTFSADGELLASGSTNGTIHLWDTATWGCRKTVLKHPEGIRSLAFSPDGQILASGGNDNTIRLWEVSTGRCLQVITGHGNRVWSVAFSPDGQILVSGSEDRTIRLWAMSDYSCLKILTDHSNGVRSVCFKPDASILASGGEDQAVRLWDVESGHCLQTLQGYTNRIWSLAFGPTSKTLVSACEDQTLHLWDAESDQPIRTIQARSHGARSVAYHPAGRILASGGEDQKIRLWDTAAGLEIRKLQGHTNWIWTVAFSPTGDMLASGSEDKTVRLWSISTGRTLQVLHGHTRWVRSVSFSPDGKLVASGGDDHTIKLWDTETGTCLRTLRGHSNLVRCVAFSPGGRVLASSSEDQTIRLWDTSSGLCLSILTGHTSLVRSVSFHQNGAILASGGEDQTIRLWDTSSGLCLSVLAGHNSRVRGVCFSPDGNTLASASDDGTIILWNLETGHPGKYLRHERPYENMNIALVEGLTEAQKDTLRILGAK